jgi:hypothetical protein
MRNKNLRYFVVLICILAIIIIGMHFKCGGKKTREQMAYFTQCVDRPVIGSRSMPFETYVTSAKKTCYALLWQIPNIYHPEADKVSSGEVVVSEVVMRAWIPDMTPTNESRQYELSRSPYTDIRIKSLGGFDSFDKSVRGNWFPPVVGSYGIRGVPANIPGLFVYAKSEKKEDLDIYGIYFVPSPLIETVRPWRYVIHCGDGHIASYKTVPSDSICRVESEIDDRTYAEYSIYYAQSNHINEITDSVSHKLKSFMLN